MHIVVRALETSVVASYSLPNQGRKMGLSELAIGVTGLIIPALRFGMFSLALLGREPLYTVSVPGDANFCSQKIRAHSLARARDFFRSEIWSG